MKTGHHQASGTTRTTNKNKKKNGGDTDQPTNLDTTTSGPVKRNYNVKVAKHPPDPPLKHPPEENTNTMMVAKHLPEHPSNNKRVAKHPPNNDHCNLDDADETSKGTHRSGGSQRRPDDHHHQQQSFQNDDAFRKGVMPHAP